LKTFFVPECAESEIVVQSESEASSSKTEIVSKSKNSKSKVMTNSDSKTPKIKILKRSEPIPQSLMNSESGILNLSSRGGKQLLLLGYQKPKGVKPKVLSEQKPLNFQHEVQKKKSKISSTNPKEPIRIWVPKICLRVKEKQRSWYLDSGCSRHMT
jgi:hypothetical protein